MSEPGEVRRFEVFTGTGRRRRWPLEVRAQIVAECDRPGATVSGVARRHGLTAQQLFMWRRQAREAVGVAATGGRIGFVPVTVDHQAAVIEVVLGAAVIRVPNGVDAATLRAVVSVLTSRA